MAIEKSGDMQPEHKFTLSPIIGLTENLPKRDLEQIAIQATKMHRRLRDVAEAKYEEWRKAPPLPVLDTVGPARIAYVAAMIDMHAQRMVLSTLLDILGHVPPVPGD